MSTDDGVKAPTLNLAPNSRYFGAVPGTLTLADGREVSYLPRRFVPPPERFVTLELHRVERGERPDTVAFGVIGDAEQYWRIADANAVLHPAELTEQVGRAIRITLPEGVPAPPEGLE